ncbi:MAG TPA: hypothetical protein VND94_01065 [Terriglobia bacterium]|nr:hypothetical protein [Terriglobia bacterium]
MSFAIWPPALAGVPVSWRNYREVLPDAVKRTQNDTGPDKVRRRTTAGLRNLYVSVTLSDTELPLFKDFFRNTTLRGALMFDWIHPRTGAPTSMRFVAEPQYSVIGATTYRASFQVEITDPAPTA